MVISRVDGKALQGNSDGTTMFKTVNFNEPAQKWIQTSVGNQLLNLKTGKSLEIYDGKSWIFDDKMRIVNARYSTKVLASSWSHDDGRSVHMWEKDSWVSPTQRFCIVDSKHTKNEISGKKANFGIENSEQFITLSRNISIMARKIQTLKSKIRNNSL